jgi:cation:H+ antiporter
MLFSLVFATLLSDNLFDSSLTNTFTRGDGVILLLFFCVFIYYLISMSRNKVEKEEDEEIISMKKAIILTIAGLIGIVFGSNFVVDSATYIASYLGVSQRLISLTIIAFGTSLPELVTSVTATKKGEYDIAIGNVVGSNIFNIGMVIGIPTALFGGIGVITFSYIDLIVMIGAAVLLFMFSFNDYKITKKEGILFLIVFIAYYSYVLVS